MFLLKNTTHRMIIRHHSKIGHLYVPNQVARIPHERGGYVVQTNNLGFRSDLEFEKKHGEKPRILFFGDSLTAGDGCYNQERFADQVGEILNAEVYNFGLSGSGTDQHLLIFEEFAKSIEADLIVIGVYIENIERIKVAYRPTIDRYTGRRLLVPKPYFTLDDKGKLKLHHFPVPVERPEENSVDLKVHSKTASRDSNPAFDIFYKIADAAVRSSFFNRLGKIFSPGRADDFNLIRSMLLKIVGFQPYADYKDFQGNGCCLMKAILERFVDGLGGIPVLIVPIPGDHHYLDKLKPIYQPFYKRLESYRPNVSVMDITTPLSDLSLPERKKLRFSKDYHFSPFGHYKIAELIAKQIRSRNLLPKQLDRCKSVKISKDSIYILGISCFYHNSAASLIKDGKIIAAAEEERFTRVKHDRRFPAYAINFCLEQGKIDVSELKAVVYYDCIQLTFERLMKTAVEVADKGLDFWQRMLSSWLLYKLRLPHLVRQHLKYDGAVLKNLHHRSHAASAFFPSPFKQAAILTIDGVGEWATATIGIGKDDKIEILKEMHFPDSLGLLYSAFTQFVGFKVNNGEYKLMGLAPYGKPVYVDMILKQLVSLKDDGSVELNMDYFAFLSKPSMINEKFAQLFGGPARLPESRITQREMDIARSIQWITEEAVLRMAKEAKRLTGESKLCLAGGVALNCVANGRILREGPFEDIWIQPAAGDSGASLGAALDAYHTYFKKPRVYLNNGFSLQGGSFLGPEFSDDEIKAFLETYAYPAKKFSSAGRAKVVAQALAEGKVVGHFSGRAEFGPRALGSRSILGDSRNPETQVNLNLKIKNRESFRPFAPTVLAERVEDYFKLDRKSPYMLIVAPVKEDIRLPFERGNSDDMLGIVRQPRSSVPAITHIDFSARIQTLNREEHPAYYDVIKAFDEQTGCGVLVNTSFNVRGEPIVNTPHDAYRCFMRTEMDMLVLENYVLLKKEQPAWLEEKIQIDEFKAETIVYDSKFMATLEKIFKQEFLPIAHKLKLIDNYKPLLQVFKQTKSRWLVYQGPKTPAAVFQFPQQLLDKDINCRDLAEAIMSVWSDPTFVNNLMPVMISLLRVSQKFKIESKLEEEVSDSVYVMF